VSIEFFRIVERLISSYTALACRAARKSDMAVKGCILQTST